MDESEYKLLEHKYSKEEEERINSFNIEHTNKAYSLLKYNRDQLLNNKEYAEFSLENRIKHIQSSDEFKDFCKLYPIVSKYIIAFGLFSKKAFVKFLSWKAKMRPSNEMRSRLAGNQREQEKFKNKYIYAVYVKFLYEAKTTHEGIQSINKVYTQTYEELNSETDKFFDLYEQESKKLDLQKELADNEKKQKIINQLKFKLNNE